MLFGHSYAARNSAPGAAFWPWAAAAQDAARELASDAPALGVAAGFTAWPMFGAWADAAAATCRRHGAAAMDAVLYDIGALDAGERRLLAELDVSEGEILLVRPSGTGPIGLFSAAEDFAASEGAQVAALAVTGRGVGALGAAAFARNVADALGEPTAVVAPAATPTPVDWMGGSASWDPGPRGARAGRDSAALLRLLSDPRLDVDLVVAHSSGAHLASDALFAEQELARGAELARGGADAADAAPGRRLLTLCGAAAAPRRHEATHVIGAFDALGWALSDGAVEVAHTPLGVAHHTNRRIPGHLDVEDTVRRLAGGRARRAARRRRAR